MTDEVGQLIERQQFPREPAWVMPAYGGQCFTNLIHSLFAHFGLAYETPLAFHEEFTRVLAGRRKIILLIMDGFGWFNLAHTREMRPVIGEVFDRGRCWPLTSVFPSTTSAALTSYVTGLPPAEHGIIGYLMAFPEYGRIFNMIHLVTANEPTDRLLDHDFSPDAYLRVPSIFTRFAEADVLTGAYTYSGYAGSGLSRLLYRQLLPYPYFALGDLYAMLLQQTAAAVPQFLYLYWANLDTIGHTYGADSEAYAIELAAMATMLRDEVLPRLDADTALLICADHGVIDGNDDFALDLKQYPALTTLFRMPPAGEGRSMHLFIREDGIEPAQEILRGIDHLVVLTREEFIASGLLGPGAVRVDLLPRIGDLIAMPKGDKRILYDYRARPHTSMCGRHGGMSPREMVVPLVVF